jgi:hypothetical protein
MAYIDQIDLLAPPFGISDTDPTFFENFYKDIAESYDKVIRYESYSDTHAYAAVETIVDIDNSDESSQLIEVSLLQLFQDTYVRIRKYFQKMPYIFILVETFNDFFVDNNFEEGNLTTFVNGILWDDDEYNGLVPYYWAWLCENVGIDISGWNIEPNPNPSE